MLFIASLYSDIQDSKHVYLRSISFPQQHPFHGVITRTRPATSRRQEHHPCSAPFVIPPFPAPFTLALPPFGIQVLPVRLSPPRPTQKRLVRGGNVTSLLPRQDLSIVPSRPSSPPTCPLMTTSCFHPCTSLHPRHCASITNTQAGLQAPRKVYHRKTEDSRHSMFSKQKGKKPNKKGLVFNSLLFSTPPTPLCFHAMRSTPLLAFYKRKKKRKQEKKWGVGSS